MPATILPDNWSLLIDQNECIELAPQRRCEIRDTGDSQIPDVTTAYTRAFRIKTKDARVGPMVVKQALTSLFLVDLGKPYTNGTSSTDIQELDGKTACNAIEITQESDDGLSWICVCSYDWFDPFGLPPRVSRDYQQFEKILDIDQDGKAVLNSAKDPFDPPVTIDDSRQILTISRYEQAFDDSLPETYKDAINTDTVLGFGPYTVKCNKITPVRLWSAALVDSNTGNQGYYYDVTYELAINPDGWRKRILDLGYRELTSGGSKTAILLADGTPATVPVPLNGTGQKAIVKAGETYTGVYLTYKGYRELPFAPLALSFT